MWLEQLKEYVNNFATASSAKVGRCFILRTAFLINFDKVPQNRAGLNSVLSIADRYGLDRPGSISCGTDILPAVKTVLEAHSDSCSEHRDFPGDKAAAASWLPPTPSCTKIANGLELFLHFPSVPAEVVYFSYFRMFITNLCQIRHGMVVTYMLFQKNGAKKRVTIIKMHHSRLNYRHEQEQMTMSQQLT